MPNQEAALKEATRTCGAMIRDMDGLPLGCEWQMEVADEEGPIFAITVGAKQMRWASR
ncbi:DUF6894 family protein [Chelativorans sp.]|uniref:DUF6894 family protein n=1 Tax=Chelativorans sp. TaxID=2203393 RepID=UPI002811593E|nr:hypothetical protein [Chelativorans sp.]